MSSINNSDLFDFASANLAVLPADLMLFPSSDFFASGNLQLDLEIDEMDTNSAAFLSFKRLPGQAIQMPTEFHLSQFCEQLFASSYFLYLKCTLVGEFEDCHVAVNFRNVQHAKIDTQKLRLYLNFKNRQRLFLQATDVSDLSEDLHRILTSGSGDTVKNRVTEALCC